MTTTWPLLGKEAYVADLSNVVRHLVCRDDCSLWRIALCKPGHNVVDEANAVWLSIVPYNRGRDIVLSHHSFE